MDDKRELKYSQVRRQGKYFIVRNEETKLCS